MNYSHSHLLRSRPARATSMVLAAVLALAAAAAPPGAAGQSSPDALAGDWSGELEISGTSLRIVFHFEQPAGDSLSATMDSPDQGAYGISAGPVRIDADSVVVPVPPVGGIFRGVYRVTDVGPRIEGSWSQGAVSLDLVLAPASDGEAGPPKRPQEPAEPPPYRSEDVTFTNRADGITLAGTFTRPRGEGPFPAVALISGSGPQDRDETILGHRPFLVLADRLTRRGIAVLRYDDRGVGESGGEFASATSQDFARDAAAAVEWLAGREAVDPGAVGLVGHSEGGLVAPLVSRRTHRVGFLVLLAGPALSGEEILYLQGEALTRAAGVTEAEVRAVRERQERLFRAVLEKEDPEARERRLRNILEEELAADSAAVAALPTEAARANIDARIRQLSAPWFRFFLRHDPAPVLRRLEVPVLALYGGKDLQVPADTNAAVMERTLEAAPTDRFRVQVLEDLNHLFQHAETGLPSEYGAIEETLAPGVMEMVADWILEVAGRLGREAS